MRVLVTGGSGFLGKFVIRELVARGHHPVALARSASSAAAVAAAGAEPIAGDLDEPATVDEAFAGAKADALANIASLGFGHGATVVASAEEAAIERALFVSTTAIFTSLPAASKAVRTAAEDAIRASNLAWTIVRPTMIYGAPGDRNMERLLRLLQRAPVLPLPGGGRRLIQPVHVADLAWFIVTALESGAVGSEFDVGGPEPLSLRSVVEQAGTVVRRRPRLVCVPLRPAVAAVQLYGRVSAHPRIKVEQVLRLNEDKAFDITAALSLGFRPRTFERGIADEAEETCTPVVGVGTYLRTVAHLRPEQIAHRIRLRAIRRLDRWRPPPVPPVPVGAPGWPAGFRSLEAGLDHGDPVAISQGRFTFLHDERSLGEPADWNQTDATRLWRFNLHYFEWAWALAAAGDRDTFARLWRSWRDSTTVGHPDAWAPYVASLRAWVLSDVFEALVRGSDLEDELLAALSQHLAFLRRRLEFDVGGNHLIKNLKGIIGLGTFLGQPHAVDQARSLLAAQIPIQVLSDGGHFELSPSYHCQVLEDLLDIASVLEAAGATSVPGLANAVERMRQWLGIMVGPDGEVPWFNDCFPVGTARINRLQPIPNDKRLVVLEASGYVVAHPAERAKLVADVGNPCPPDLPAHAHADCLSFELWVDGTKVITDGGTSTYQTGARRSLERSTGFHNTIELDHADQSELWGAFRAGRRAKGSLESVRDDGQTIIINGSHDGYRFLPGAPIHRRSWTVSPGRLTVEDRIEVTDRSRHTMTCTLHLSDPGRLIRIRGDGGNVFDEFSAARTLGERVPSRCLRLGTDSDKGPLTTKWTVTW